MIHELSIVIPALNEEKYLPNLLNCLIEQKFQGKFEVIVVDGESTDNTVLEAKKFKKKFPKLTILKTKKGISRQRNLGVLKARYKNLLFLDADMLLSRNFLQTLQNKLPEKEFFLGTTFGWLIEKHLIANLVCAVHLPLALFYCLYKRYVPGFLIFTTKKLHKKLKGFREDLKIAEDIDFAIRAKKLGAKYHFYFSPMCFHSARRMIEMGSLNFTILHFKGLFFFRKHGLEGLSDAIYYPFGKHYI